MIDATATKAPLALPPVWLVLLAAAGAFALTMGVRQTMGLFLSPLNTATQLGLGSISLAFAFGQLWWGLTQPFAGALADRVGAGRTVLAGVLPPLQEQGVYLAAQCCEHLNRSIVIEREAAKANGYQIVSAIPQPHAGGSWATNCWQRFNDPVLVEEVRAAAGMDIGGTLIGMHLRRVAVPVRLSMDHIGQAILLCARTRPPFIGGSRAVYSQEEVR